MVCIFYIYHKDQLNVGRYTSPMDGMGILEVSGVSDRYIYLRRKVVKLKALDAFECIYIYMFVHLKGACCMK